VRSPSLVKSAELMKPQHAAERNAELRKRRLREGSPLHPSARRGRRSLFRPESDLRAFPHDLLLAAELREGGVSSPSLRVAETGSVPYSSCPKETFVPSRTTLIAAELATSHANADPDTVSVPSICRTRASLPPFRKRSSSISAQLTSRRIGDHSICTPSASEA
jgi:hypothetical protein